MFMEVDVDEEVDEDTMADNAVGHGGIKTGWVDSKEAQRSHFVVTPWVGLPSTSVLEATDIDQNVTQSLFLTQFDHFHFHPTLELKSRVILRSCLTNHHQTVVRIIKDSLLFSIWKVVTENKRKI